MKKAISWGMVVLLCLLSAAIVAAVMLKVLDPPKVQAGRAHTHPMPMTFRIRALILRAPPQICPCRRLAYTICFRGTGPRLSAADTP